MFMIETEERKKMFSNSIIQTWGVQQFFGLSLSNGLSPIRETERALWNKGSIKHQIQTHSAIGLFETRGMHAHFIDAKRDRTRESAVAHRNTYPSFDASGPEPVLKAFRKAPEPPVVEDEKTWGSSHFSAFFSDNHHSATWDTHPSRSSNLFGSFLIWYGTNKREGAWLSTIYHNLNFRSPVAPKVAMDRKRSPSAEDYLDFESPKPPKNPENTKNEKRNGSFDDVLAELAKRQAEMQEYWHLNAHDKLRNVKNRNLMRKNCNECSLIDFDTRDSSFSLIFHCFFLFCGKYSKMKKIFSVLGMIQPPFFDST